MRKLQLDELALFARVVELGSLSAAARERAVPVSQVSRTLVRLEQACGARLLQRSTHSLSLTDEGATFLTYSRRALETMDELEGEFAARSGGPSGRVRVACSAVIAQYQLVPSLPQLAQRHPGVQVDLQVSDRLVDMARDGIDIAIRTGSALPDTVVARQIGTHARRLYAAPAYLHAHGLPERPQDLARHALVTNSEATALNAWPFRIEGEPFVFPARGAWSASDTGMTAAMVLQGLGIGRIASLVGDVLVREGRLLPVLAQFTDPQPAPVHAVTLGARQRLPKIRACLDFWAGWFGSP